MPQLQEFSVAFFLRRAVFLCPPLSLFGSGAPYYCVQKSLKDGLIFP